ncbi:hypothetical protein MFLAVUS_005538 [Mucor flavus]|uniref:sterol 3beta-glucosyltransferase n=1 Tax=Mucor flavus TaxID=439312 RepID=A0ABP9YZ14_9FUNG
MSDVSEEQLNYIGKDKAVQTEQMIVSDEHGTISDSPPNTRPISTLTRNLTEMSIECSPISAKEENTIKIDDIGDMEISKKGIVQDKVKTVFELPDTEILVNEFPCYFIRLVTIPGWMYITNNHICFYASLPAKKKGPHKSGYLSKKNHITSPRTYRYFFELKNHVLSWYSSAESKYSPLNSIDLKYVTKIEPSRLKKHGIRLHTADSQNYTIIADSELSQKEWMDELRKGVFVAQHSGNSVRIVLPFTKIAFVEKPSVFEFANNIKIKFVDDIAEEEDYYFAFFPDIELVFNEIMTVWRSHAPIAAVTLNDVKKRPLSMPPNSKPSSNSTSFLSFDTFFENVSPAALPTMLMGKLMSVTGLFQNNSTTSAMTQEEEEEEVLSDNTEYETQVVNTNQQRSHLFSSVKIPSMPSNSKDPVLSTSPPDLTKKQKRNSIFFNWTTSEPMVVVDTNSSSSDTLSSAEESSPTSDDRSKSQTTRPRSSTFNSISKIPRAVSEAIKHQVLPQPQPGRSKSNSLSMLRKNIYPFYRSNSRKDANYMYTADTTVHPNQSGDISLTPPQVITTRNRSASLGNRLMSGGSKTWHKLTPSGDFYFNQQHMNENQHRHPKGPMWTNTKMINELKRAVQEGELSRQIDTSSINQVNDQESASNSLDVSLAEEQRTMNEHLNANFPMLLKTEHVEAAFKASFWRTIPYPGKIYITDRYFCFHSKILAGQQKLIVPWSDVIQVDKPKSKSYYLLHGISLIVKNITDPIYFDFSSLEIRDYCFAVCSLKYENQSTFDESSVYSKESRIGAFSMSSVILDRSEHIEPPIDFDGPPLLANSISTPSTFTKKYNLPEGPLHFTCLTIGSRGDVQPYVALCKELQKDGHRCRIATHPEYKKWITDHGIEFRSVGGDPGELMENFAFLSVSFIREGTKFFYHWFESLLESAYEACKGTDVLIESPSVMIGVHMAEKLGIPYIRSMPFPFTRTTKFPHPFAMQATAGGRIYNDMTYVMIDMALWTGTARYVNRFRRKVLHLPSTTLDKLQLWKVPYIYSFSPIVVHPPKDWPDFIHCTGYWFLDNSDQSWEPDSSLVQFLKGDQPIVYIGFGSIIVPDAAETTRTIVDAVLKSGIKAIICKGWSTRSTSKKPNEEEEVLLDSYPGIIYHIDAVPHDWLFPQIQAVVHHGGAGTTAAGLRAGLPTVVKPFFGDQRFWGQRVEELGVGLCLNKLTKNSLTDALISITQNRTMIAKAQGVGEMIRKENGPRNAVESIYREFEFAKEQRV